jgi:hypothetical protein
MSAVTARSGSVPILAWYRCALAGMGAARWGWRRWREAHLRPDPASAKRLVVLGTGKSADAVVACMLTDLASTHLLVTLLDDDPAKTNLRVGGVAVQSTRADLAWTVAGTRADAVLVAIARADRNLLGECNEAATSAGVEAVENKPCDGAAPAPISPGPPGPAPREAAAAHLRAERPAPHKERSLAMRAVIPDGAGFIGSHLADRCLADGHRVTVLDALSTGQVSQHRAPVSQHGAPVGAHRLRVRPRLDLQRRRGPRRRVRGPHGLSPGRRGGGPAHHRAAPPPRSTT